MNNHENEIDRLRKVYALRKETIPSYRYSFFDSANLFIFQKKEYELLKLLRKYKITCLSDKKILDVGCGIGNELRRFIFYGARPENLHGIDLLPDRIEIGRELSPNIEFQCADASEIPYEDASFDIVTQNTVFTSILCERMKQKISQQILRVLKPDGVIVWYDYQMDNPKNRDVKGVKKREIYNLFPGCEVALKRITLAPPLARALAPYSLVSCYLLEKLSFLNTHYIGVIKKKSR